MIVPSPTVVEALDHEEVREVILVTGPPGAGKSTVAASLAGLLDPSALVAGDDFFGFLRNGAISPWLKEAHGQNRAVVQAAAAASGQLAGHCAVVFDGVVGPWFLPTYLTASGLKHVHYAVLLPPQAVCVQRVRSRRRHGFTDLGAAESMWREFHRAQLDPRHLVTDPEAQPDEVARTLADRLSIGSIRYP